MRATLLLTIGLWSSRALASDAAHGKALYMSNCMACHGTNADGKGPAAAALKPPPRDFTDPAFWASKTDAQVAATIKSGRPGTAMMPFPQLTQADLDDLVAYLRTRKN